MRVLSTPFKLLGYYVSFFFFGTFGAALSLFSLLCGWLPDTPATERFFQRLIHRHFALWIWWMTFARLFRIRYEGLERLPPARTGCLLVANHPGLMDITYLLARVPEAVCIFKPGIRRNPVLGAAARRAGYLASDGGIDLLRAAADRAAAGNTLIIFPEGTRTRDGVLNPLKPGFVLIARKAGVPIHPVRITCDSNLLIKGRAWWKLPRLPAHVVVCVGPRFSTPAERKSADIMVEVETWLRAGLPGSPSQPVAMAAGLSPTLQSAS